MSDVPEFVSACSRRAQRHPVLHAGEVFVELAFPAERTWNLEVLEISTDGLSFGLQDGQPDLKVGSIVDGVAIRFGDKAILGSLTVAHVTEEFSSGTVCGAAFVPASETDRYELDNVIAQLAIDAIL